MDKSTFETFEEELGTQLQDAPPAKPLRQSRRSETYQRRVKEESPALQQVLKSAPREIPGSRGVSLRKPVSMQNVAQAEPPWEGVTLNRCLFIAITILVLTSGCQRLQEFLRGRKDTKVIDTVSTAINVRHSALRKGRFLPAEPDTSLWNTFLWWVGDDDDDDDEEEESRRGRSGKVTRDKTTRGLRHKAIPDRKLLKERENRFRGRSRKARQNKDEPSERAKAQKAVMQKDNKDEEKLEREKTKKVDKKTKESNTKVNKKVQEKP